ncbi:MAG: dTMP kinase [Candidatus Omnitrophica bacterium]|nr:dTMP kinase [Candidatus Omnitrophota bacterium]
MAEKINKGIFIVLDGPDGCGKSTQSRRLKEDLVSRGHEVVLTQEPGGTDLGGMIRDVILKKENIKLERITELFLFETDRAQHVGEIIKPALEDGKTVICDRFNAATFAYQGYALGMDIGLIKELDSAATGGLEPDLTLILDVDIKTGLERAGHVGQADRMEKRGFDFHEKVRQGFLDIAKNSPDKFRVIEVQEDMDHTHRLVKEAVLGVLEK